MKEKLKMAGGAKTARTIGCFLLLTVLICGCALFGRRIEVSAETPNETGQENNTPTIVPSEEESSAAPESPAPEGSVTVKPTYSEGLSYRSNGDGTCALSGLGSFDASCLLIPPTSPVGDKVTEILPFALSGSLVAAVEIPATVEKLDAAAFAGCQRLACVRVAAGNPAFSEQGGVLYNKDASILVYCPAALPGSALSLPDTLRRILPAAFAECPGMQTVIYPGSAAAWHAIIVGDDNAPLYAADIKLGSG